MPGVSDPGQVLVNYCIKNSIEYDILPGANALLSAFVASGFEETKLLFFGFLDHKGASRAAGLQKVLFSGYTTVVYESPHRIEKLLNEIDEIEPQRELFLAKELTKKYQTYFRGTSKDALKKFKNNFRGEWVVVLSATKEHSQSAITQKDILSLDLPKKVQAKLICKITGENTKECYQRLLDI
jgi:16S rRNA (cytidine1402-2'-O)-methyltransferase